VTSLSLRQTVAALVVAGSVFPACAQRWQVQYFYDKSKETFAIADLAFPSATRGVAVGVIVEGTKRKPTSVVTADGGAHWQVVEIKEAPISLFFLNESLGWMVTSKGLWQTNEAGKSWKKMSGLPSGMLRVYFRDEQNGFAVGTKKRVLITTNGGARWEPLAAAAQPPGMDKYSAYSWVAFATRNLGIISGWNAPPRYFPQQFPDWMDPEGAVSRRETPHLSYQLTTNDGGKTWKSNSASLLGDITRVRFHPNGIGLGLVEHGNSFRYPSEVYKIDWVTGKSETIYRDRKFDISDIWITPDGTAWLAGVVVAGEIRNVVPGRVQVLQCRAKDFSVWTALDVDYRAEANQVVISGVDDRNLWLATDNGMILKLTW
jgi:photosystem II stability/assembly factor-like uncharacterized protein